jgi:hypothetical protein
MEYREIPFVEFRIEQNSIPIVIPQREEIVPLCVILNEWAVGKLAGYLPKEIEAQHRKNRDFGMTSEDGRHEVTISKSTTVLRRLSWSTRRDTTIEFERKLETQRIISIINKWDQYLGEISK